MGPPFLSLAVAGMGSDGKHPAAFFKFQNFFTGPGLDGSLIQFFSTSIRFGA